mmetsp:Transcript_14079/g.39416  ORF Transcript_14079/g.39416 Transcript_14079/m.39416 type:complete len:269 (+) Transcript_14079:1384-2190(+)
MPQVHRHLVGELGNVPRNFGHDDSRGIGLRVENRFEFQVFVLGNQHAGNENIASRSIVRHSECIFVSRVVALVVVWVIVRMIVRVVMLMVVLMIDVENVTKRSFSVVIVVVVVRDIRQFVAFGVGNQNGSSSQVLGIANLLDKGAISAFDQEDKGRSTVFWDLELVVHRFKINKIVAQILRLVSENFDRQHQRSFRSVTDTSKYGGSMGPRMVFAQAGWDVKVEIGGFVGWKIGVAAFGEKDQDRRKADKFCSKARFYHRCGCRKWRL